jgi:redox-regulated HSP33 family molecular chaperone
VVIEATQDCSATLRLVSLLCSYSVLTIRSHAGTLAIVRTQPLSPKPYSSVVEITSGEVAEDLAVYMAESEQTNSAIALGVQIGPEGLVSAAGGYLIQVDPLMSSMCCDMSCQHFDLTFVSYNHKC